ncbi:protein suppressor of sable [Tribolium madens]|uniref:protein suppressor of sable n=1 Tax=Tribolium madens TaxID=41895 RepID=UPI001CF76417|nr:protein suppressor of sable [Tribolium madens]
MPFYHNYPPSDHIIRLRENMALVCDVDNIESATPQVEEQPQETKEEAKEQEIVQDNDLEDGEIEDDGEDEPPVEAAPPPPKDPEPPKEKPERDRTRHERSERRRHDDKKKHMTEAEKSILHLRKRERMQREKWEKYRKEQNMDPAAVDDFAINIEKAIASVLKKDKHVSDEEKDDDKRGRKRKNRDKDRPKGGKQRKIDSPKAEDDENASPKSEEKRDRSASPRSEDSYTSDESDRSRSDRKRDHKKGKGRNRQRKRSRERRNEQQQQNKDSQGVCVFFLQGKCQKNDCPYSHEAVPPMKLELCKFYLKDCCAKGEKCSYMHSEFPCKLYHTGLVCVQGDNCKFAHGKPLDEHRKQILFKHIETAPREILGGFPRMNREELLNKINVAQQNLMVQYGIDKSDKGMPMLDINMGVPPEIANDCNKKRNKPSRWQDPDPVIKPFGLDQDMRVNSNGDIDMRTLPPLAQMQPQIQSEETSGENDVNNFTQDIDIRNPNMLQFDTKDVDIRQQMLASKDIDIRQILPVFEENKEPEVTENALPDLPKTPRELYLRIQSQQKTNLPEQQPETIQVDENINWYSDDDDEDENRLTIKVDNEEEKKEESENIMSPPQIKPLDVVEKLGDLSKIDISAEVTKLLTSMSQQKEAQKPAIRDPRQQRTPSTEQKISIYEQGSIISDEPKSPDQVVESDIRGRPDVDLRNLHLPFKGMLNYTPAKEIDASVNSHPPMIWKVEIVDIPRPDYTGLKLNIQDAEKTGDPRLKKIFRLSTEEKDSPASPKASPKARIDPRLKKIEEKQQDSSTLTYNQQLNILQSSAFFQSLTSNQKLLLNQELAARSDQNGFHDPVLNSMLSTLNLIPTSNMNSPNMGAALNILANVNKLNPGMISNPPPMVMRQNPNMMAVQPGLLGAAPGIPNIPNDFPMNFDPRINNAPPPPFGNFPPENNFGGFDDYYQQDNNFANRDNNRNFNRDRRRGRNNFNRNNGNRNFRNRNNRNRGHTPP